MTFTSFLNGLVILTLISLNVTPSLAGSALRWNFVEGNSLKVNTQQVTHQKAGDIQVRTELHIFTTWNVDYVEQSGTAIVRQTVDRITFQMSLPSGEFAYDSSSSEPPSGTVKMLSGSYLSLLNRPIEMKVSAQGKMLQAQWGKPAETPSSLNTTAAKGNANDGELELTRLHGSIIELPEKELQKGDSWQSKYSTSLPTINESMETSNTYTYRGQREVRGQSLDHIDITGGLTIGRGEAGKSALNVEKQDVRGSILFDTRSGRLVESEVDCEVTVMITTGDQQVTHELKTQTKTEVTPVEIEAVRSGDSP